MSKEPENRISFVTETDGKLPMSWPENGRDVFGPWCLLGLWPVVFGVVEKNEKREDRKP